MTRICRFETLESKSMLSANAQVLFDFSLGDRSSTLENFAQFGDLLFFNVNETQLWRTDGTTDGTVELAETQLFGTSIETRGLTLFNTEQGIWRTDGTPEGTFQLIENTKLAEANRRPNTPHPLIETPEFTLFNTNGSVWRTDGTAEGTWMVANDRLKFSATPAPDENGEYTFFMDIKHVWKTDGTAEGTRLWRELSQRKTGQADELVALQTNEDGSTETVVVHSYTNFGLGFTFHTVLNGRLVYSEDIRSTPRPTWTTDGRNISPETPLHGADAKWIGNRNGEAYFIDKYEDAKVLTFDGDSFRQLAIGDVTGTAAFNNHGFLIFNDVWRSPASKYTLIDEDNQVLPLVDLGEAKEPLAASRVGDIGYGLRTARFGQEMPTIKLHGTAVEFAEEDGEKIDFYDGSFLGSPGEQLKPANAPLYYTAPHANNIGLWMLDGGSTPLLVDEFASFSSPDFDWVYTDLGFVYIRADDHAHNIVLSTGENTFVVDNRRVSNPDLIAWDGPPLLIGEAKGVGRELWTIEVEETLDVRPDQLRWQMNLGDGLQLSATVQNAANDVVVSWDINGDGVFTDAVGAEPSLSWQELSSLTPPLALGEYSIAVRATDSLGTVVTIQHELVVTRTGDLNEDFRVDFADFLILSGNFGSDGERTDGDLDQDGTVGFADFLLLSANFGRT